MRVLVLAALVLALAGCAIGAPAHGPLEQPGAYGITVALRPGESVTLGVIAPANPLDSDIRLVSAEPARADGVSLLGILLRDPRDESIASALGFPPDGVRGTPISGGLVRPGQEPELLIGLTLATDATGGEVEGIVLRYEAGGQSYTTTLPWTLRIEPPDN